jgi:hypothetical protein
MNDKRISTTSIDLRLCQRAAARLRRITTRLLAPLPQQERSDQQPGSLHGNQDF